MKSIEGGEIRYMNTISEGSDFYKLNPLILSLAEKCMKIECLQRVS